MLSTCENLSLNNIMYVILLRTAYKVSFVFLGVNIKAVDNNVAISDTNSSSTFENRFEEIIEVRNL